MAADMIRQGGSRLTRNGGGKVTIASCCCCYFCSCRYFETVGILQKAGVDLGQLGGKKGGGETAIDIDKIPQVCCGRLGVGAGSVSLEGGHSGHARVSIPVLTRKPEAGLWGSCEGCEASGHCDFRNAHNDGHVVPGAGSGGHDD